MPLGRFPDDGGGGVDVAVHEMAAEPVAQPQREFHVDRIAFVQLVEAGAHDALRHDVERHRADIVLDDR